MDSRKIHIQWRKPVGACTCMLSQLLGTTKHSSLVTKVGLWRNGIAWYPFPRLSCWMADHTVCSQIWFGMTDLFQGIVCVWNKSKRFVAM